MRKSKSVALLTAALIAGSAISPAMAQGYNDNRYNDNQYNDQSNDQSNSYDRNQNYDRSYNSQSYSSSSQSYSSSQDASPGYDRDYNNPPPDDYNNPPPAADTYDRGYQEGRAEERYRHDMRVEDDAYYNACRQQRANNQAGGLIIGAIAGGLLGNALGRGAGRAPATALGAIGGGAIGASIGGNLNCEDRGLAYKAYYDGFERGRPHARYSWRSPRTGAYGYLEVGDYFRDRDGFRCATYSQTIYIRGRQEVARGTACRQRDGYWAFVS